MRHRKKGKVLDRKKGPREALLKGLVASVVLYEKVRTTRAKAKAAQPLVERMITIGKAGTLHARRQLLRFFPVEPPVRKILEELSPRYKERAGGYTRVTRLGQRQGDGAEIVQIEFV
ncbi:MAG: 50S ribosomal protein L17 [Patescibacteria group bacterium]